MAHIVIVYHSGYGHTERQAKAVHFGATQVPETQVELLPITAEGDLPNGGWNTLAAADCIIFGTPTYMGSISWQFKKFADASSKPWSSQVWKDKLAAGFTNSASMNGDKLSTLHYLFTLAMQHSMLWIGTGMLPANSKTAQRNDLNYLGSFAGLMAQSPSGSTPEEGPPPGDLETAKAFGKRIAQLAQRWKRAANPA